MNLSWIYQSLKNRHARSSGSGLNQPLDSGLRRNDGEEEKSLVAIPMARLPLPANTQLRPLPSFMDRKSCMWREGRTPVAARRGPACMDAGGRAASGTGRRGGRAASGTKAEESSGFYNTCPHARA